jgi:tripartite-type tricarboxylate transporter receptor subunit TctC
MPQDNRNDNKSAVGNAGSNACHRRNTMSVSRRCLLASLGAAPIAALLPRRAFAAYPDRAIHLIVPFAAGGNADIVGRLVGEVMSQALKQPVVVENRAGAGGGIGADYVAKATPDGYTLLVGSNGPLTVNPFVQAHLGYDPLKDFASVALTSYVPHALILSNTVAAKSIADLVTLSKTAPLSIATSGVGSASHMTLERFKAATGAAVTHVPYRGGGALLPDLLSGSVQGAMTELSTALPMHQGGQAHIMAVAAAQRSRLAPDIPTFDESGVKGLFGAELHRGAGAGQDPAGHCRDLAEGGGEGARRRHRRRAPGRPGLGDREARADDAAGLRRVHPHGLREHARGREGRGHCAELRARPSPAWRDSGMRGGRSRRSLHSSGLRVASGSALAERLPHPVGGRHDARSDHELGAHEDHRARPPHHPTVGFDEIADLDRVDEVHVELHGRLGLALVGVPAGHAHRAVREGHQHAALDDAAAVVVLGLGHEGIAKAVAEWSRPERADQADEALVAVWLPSGGRGIEGGRFVGND